MLQSNPVKERMKNELNNVQLQFVLELEGLLVNESGKSVTSHVISVYVYTVSGVELNCYKIPRASAVGDWQVQLRRRKCDIMNEAET
jgi:hypothetical protein